MSIQTSEKATGVVSVTSPMVTVSDVEWSVPDNRIAKAQKKLKDNYALFSKTAKANGVKLIGKPHL